MEYEHHAFAAVVLLDTPQGIPLVMKKSKPRPWFWRLPGGRSERVPDGEGGTRDETPEECACREMLQETGVELKRGDLQLVQYQPRENHIFCVFRARLLKLPNLLQFGNNGEEVRVFQPEDILQLSDFMPGHKAFTEKILQELVVKRYT